VVAEEQTVVDHWTQQEERGYRDRQQRDEVVGPVKRRQPGEAGVERHHQQKREHHLDPGAARPRQDLLGLPAVALARAELEQLVGLDLAS
jgi:hypothetical protein